MRIVRDDLWLCDECVIIAVNGDASSLDYYYPEAEAAERLAEIEAGLTKLGPNLVADNDNETGDGVDEFRAAPFHGCACCGTTLAGRFHRFAILGPDEP